MIIGPLLSILYILYITIDFQQNYDNLFCNLGLGLVKTISGPGGRALRPHDQLYPCVIYKMHAQNCGGVGPKIV